MTRTKAFADTPAGAVPCVSTDDTWGDRIGRWRVRWGIGRFRYRVEPGLYAVGSPDAGSPVLVTANYRLTFDLLRRELDGVHAWVLVLDTNGINVWCAAGKRTFSTDEIVRRVRDTRLQDVVSHRKLIVPQLGAPGVAAHEVRRACGFRVVYGPVRAADVKAFLQARMQATEEMRRVTFTLGERLAVTSIDLVGGLKILVLLALVLAALHGGMSLRWLAEIAPYLAAVLAGTVVMPVLLPWIPGRAFALKGALVGGVMVAATLALLPAGRTVPGTVAVFLAATTLASYMAMNFTGSTTFTSPSGVEKEMRHALPVQLAAVALACVAWISGAWS